MGDIDDFDDLDDYLDEFDAEILDNEPGATVKEETNNTVPNADTLKSLEDVDPTFSKQMQDFMKLLGKDQMQSEDTLDKADFQGTVNETITRLKASSKEVDDSANANSSNDEELLTTLLKSLDIEGLDDDEGDAEMNELKGILNGEDAGDEDKLTNVIMKMLNKLTSKEMMYESVNNAVTSYREYFLKQQQQNVSEEDLLRYKKQHQHLKNVKDIFDDSSYDDTDQKTRDDIDYQMEQFNSLLPPPPGVITDDLTGMGIDNMNLNDSEVPKDLEGCVQQ